VHSPGMTAQPAANPGFPVNAVAPSVVWRPRSRPPVTFRDKWREISRATMWR